MTDEERREVAARLRWIDAKDDPGNTALMLDKIRRAIGVHMDAPSVFPPYEWLVTYAHVTLNRLADLMEPEGRTCHVEFKCRKGDVWPRPVGSECGGDLVHYDTVYEHGEDTCDLCPYCPNCGAKVVSI